MDTDSYACPLAVVFNMKSGALSLHVSCCGGVKLGECFPCTVSHGDELITPFLSAERSNKQKRLPGQNEHICSLFVNAASSQPCLHGITL